MPRPPPRHQLFARLSVAPGGLVRWLAFLGAVGGLAALVGGLQNKVHLLVILFSMIIGFFAIIQPVVALFVVFVARGVFDLLWWIPGTVFGLNMLQVFSGAVAGLSAAFFLLELRRFEKHPCFRPFLVYGSLMVFAFVRNYFMGKTYRLGTLDLFVQYTSPFLLLFLTSDLFRDRGLRRWLLLITTLVGVVPVSTSIWHFLQGQMGSYYLHGYYRLLGGYKNLHNHAFMMVIFSALAFFWASFPRAPVPLRAAALALMGGACFALYQTFIRTGLLGLAVFLFVFLLARRRVPLLAGALLAGALFILVDPVIRDRFMDIQLVLEWSNPLVDRDDLGSGRWGIWAVSLAEFARQPFWNQLLGIGLGGHWEMVSPWVKGHQMFIPGLDPHNDYLLLLFQVGPVGVVAYVVMVWQVVRESRALMREADGAWAHLLGALVLALAVVVLVTNAVSNSFVHRTSPAWYFWGFAGLVFAERADLARRRAPVPVEAEEEAGPAGALAAAPKGL